MDQSKQNSQNIIAESLGLMANAFGFVAALAWNDAIRELINRFIPKGQGVWGQIVYALIVTAIALSISIRLINIRKKIAGDSP